MNTLTIDGYLPRIVDTMVDRYLGVFGAVVIEGPKWCGKTSTAKNHVVSETSMANPEGDFRERTIAELEPSLAIGGERPRLIDEWQDVPKLWDAVRSEIFAGAVQDHGVGTIVGTTTYGKGVVQELRQLSDGSAVKLTVSNYYTPNGNSINKVGIKPDVEVKLASVLLNKDEITHEEDNQLQEALNVIEN